MALCESDAGQRPIAVPSAYFLSVCFTGRDFSGTSTTAQTAGPDPIFVTFDLRILGWTLADADYLSTTIVEG
jgi:hypothetical protein